MSACGNSPSHRDRTTCWYVYIDWKERACKCASDNDCIMLQLNLLFTVRISHVSVWTWDGNATIASSQIRTNVITSPTDARCLFALVNIWNEKVYPKFTLKLCCVWHNHQSEKSVVCQKPFPNFLPSSTHLHTILSRLQVDSPRHMHIDKSPAHSRKFPHRACTFCELHIRRCRHTFDCWRWAWSRDHNRTDSCPNSLCNDVGTSPDTRRTRPHPHISYHR